jgi:hypothetical protein
MAAAAPNAAPARNKFLRITPLPLQSMTTHFKMTGFVRVVFDVVSPSV